MVELTFEIAVNKLNINSLIVVISRQFPVSISPGPHGLHNTLYSAS
jgi:hypothetical protein